MNENVQAWVEALRSGDYAQGTGYLRRRDDTYCCLGVACELAVNAGVIPAPTLGNATYFYGKSGDYAGLPDEVREWLGIEGALGQYTENGCGTLAHDNDNGVTFEDIAAFIENNFERLVKVDAPG